VKKIIREEQPMTKQVTRLLIMAGLILGGCTLAPDYIQPQAPVQNAWPQVGSASAVTSEAPPAAELNWKSFFADSNLRQVVALALENNRDLRLASLNVERARGLYGIQRAELYPSLDASGTYSKQRFAENTGFVSSQVSESYSVNLGISAWEVDFFGRLRSLKDQALEAFFASEEARRGAQISLVSEVARAYLTLAADQENLQLSRATLATRQQSYELIQKSYAIGYATELDLRQAQIPLEAARVNVARFTQLVAQDKNALTLLAGSNVAEKLLPADLSSVAAPAEVSAGLPSEVLLQRPDILAAEHQLKGAYAFLGAARAAFFPRISLTSTLGTASNELSNLFGSGTKTWLFSPSLSLPVFDARTWAAYRVSQTDRDIAVAQYEKSIQTAFREVADALAIKDTIDEQIKAQMDLTSTTAEAHRLANLRYEHGLDNYLGVLDAERALFTARQNLVTLRLAKVANQVRLFAVLGGGADQPQVTAATD
jgi:multidrug efflux system outer membrane protein